MKKRHKITHWCALLLSTSDLDHLRRNFVARQSSLRGQYNGRRAVVYLPRHFQRAVYEEEIRLGFSRFSRMNNQPKH